MHTLYKTITETFSTLGFPAAIDRAQSQVATTTKIAMQIRDLGNTRELCFFFFFSLSLFLRFNYAMTISLSFSKFQFQRTHGSRRVDLWAMWVSYMGEGGGL